MIISVEHGDLQAISTDAMIVNLFEGDHEPKGAAGHIDQALGGAISELIAGGDLRGKLGETVVLYPRGAISAQRVIVVGLGDKTNFDLETIRESAAVAAKCARKLRAANIATTIPGIGISDLNVSDIAQAMVEGSLLGLYHYDAPTKKNNDDEARLDKITLITPDAPLVAEIKAGVAIGEAIAEGVYLARTLANQPSNLATPTAIAQSAQTMCAEVGLTCRVLDEEEMHKEQMGLLLSVTQGSCQPAKFIVIEHLPKKPAATESAPVILIGKGVSFDTGGYSLKPQAGMVGMKGDMSGAAAVIGAMNAIGRLNLPLHVVGLVPSVENMVSASAFKPNDVFIAKNGTSVEIINTDAEGRLILADALCYADGLNPTAVIDVATLTGHKKMALGNRLNALFSNDDALNDALLAAGEKVAEPLWRMPLDSAYDRQLKTKVADLKNDGGPAAGAVTAARFLAHFVGDWPWAHLDIAGSHVYGDSPEDTSRSYLTPGATSTPLRALVEFLQSQCEKNRT